MDSRDMNVESNNGGMESMQRKQTILFCQSLGSERQNPSKYIIVSKVELFKQRENKKIMKMWNSPIKADDLCDGTEWGNMTNAEVSVLLISECYSSLLLG